MAATGTYLNFMGTTEAAFNHYQSVFGGEFIGGIMRHGQVPAHEGQTDQSAAANDLVMHVRLEILGGHLLMGTDVTEEMGFTVTHGNGVQISLHPDTRAEADRLFTALSEGGTPTMPMSEVFWGDYYGALIDRFGINWMINTSSTV